jgi:hypothetical protein
MLRSSALRGFILLFASVGVACSSDRADDPVASTESASHSWSYFHWEKSGPEVQLPLGDNVSTAWESYLTAVSADWSKSSVIATTITEGLGGRSCKATVGRIEVCNRKYGFNGWLGLAQVWLSGGHIVKAVAKVNDSYFALSRYNDPRAKQHVLCQEVGHTLGLHHQDGTSCMNDDGGLFDAAYVAPNAHDYAQLETIYAHTHTTITSSISHDESGDELGEVVERRPHETVFLRDLGEGTRMVSWVYWAIP